MIRRILSVLFLAFPFGLYAGNLIHVSGEVVNEQNRPLVGVEVRVLDKDLCCAAEDLPCTFKTNLKGQWSMTFNAGSVGSKDKVRKRLCPLQIFEGGKAIGKEQFQFCLSGECSGSQKLQIKTIVKGSHEKQD